MSSGISRSCVSRTLFPLKSISDVVEFFRKCLETPFADGEPDLTLLSIVAGFVEISLTTGKLAVAAVTQNSASSALDPADAKCTKFPVVTYEMVNSLYTKYQNILTLVQKPKSGRYANRDVIKSVSDIIWHSLFWSSQKDRAHLQNLYSYLSFNKLDSFGAALGVVAGCQLLGYKDVHLAISEDHAWVVFGKKRQEAVEVTWHGKGSNHKRGQNISAGIDAKTWLYLGGMPVICDRYMEVASIVSAINISLTPSVDCLEVAELQQRLLWLLYDMGHLDKYPMALGNLGELEEVCPTPGKKSCEALYVEAIQSAKLYYKNQHVYPYTYQGTYYNRLGKYREAFRSWANAADVIRLYTYSCRDDEEVYKEFSEIANELIPYIMKTESSGHSGRSVLRDSDVFANILRFYDGICQWEEDSLTPILHIGWAKPLVNTISKFDHDVRSQVFIEVPEINKDGDISTNDAKKHVTPSDNKLVEGNNNSINCNKKSTFANDKSEKKNEMPTTLADLTAACGEKILNPDFLLQGGGQLFATDSKNSAARENAVSTQDVSILKKPTLTPILDPLPEVNVTLPVSPIPSNISPNEFDYEFMPKQPIVNLYSRKMLGLNKLLLAEKLNTHAILLQVTAQSVSHRKCRGMEKSAISPNQTNVQAEETSLIGTRSKRTRRE